MPPGLILYCRIRNLKSGLRPETIGADKDFKDLRAFKDFSDGGDRRECCDVGAMEMMGTMGMMGVLGVMWGDTGSELDYAFNVSLATVNFVRICMEICPGLLC